MAYGLTDICESERGEKLLVISVFGEYILK